MNDDVKKKNLKKIQTGEIQTWRQGGLKKVKAKLKLICECGDRLLLLCYKRGIGDQHTSCDKQKPAAVSHHLHSVCG